MPRPDQLLNLLRRRGLTSGGEIQRELGLSQPTMSRLVKAAGASVGRFGRSVATRYALTREVAGLGRSAPVFRVDEQGAVVEHGVLHWLAADGCWLERASGVGQPLTGLPPFVEDMRPQGYIGRGFPALHPELGLPARISDWNDDHQLIALANRGEDCVGNLILGVESLNRFLARPARPRTRASYARLAAGALSDQPGSPAGGEHPKFAVPVGDRHLLVKFASGDGAGADRWRDLLVAEHLALEVLRDAGCAVARARWFDRDGNRYLELERFDRVGRRGRRGVISLAAVNNHFLGEYPTHWSQASRQIRAEPTLNLSSADAERMVWLDTFGDLIGNTDRHFGNLSFFAEEAPNLTLTLAPVYDMLPMVFAPTATSLANRPFTPQPPTAWNRRVWHDAADHAATYWTRLAALPELSANFRRLATTCRATVGRLIAAHS